MKVNSQNYQDMMIEKFMEKDQKRMFGDGDWLFHQDSAPSHVSKSTMQYFANNNIPVISKDQWLPKSPDLAPMDYFVWGWMKNQLRKRKFTTMDGLKRAILSVWQILPQEFIENAFDSWPGRIQRVIDAKGGHPNKFSHKKSKINRHHRNISRLESLICILSENFS